MTREEFEYAIKSCGCFIYRGQTYYEKSELIKAFEDLGLIHIGLEQEPCEDAISRQAVMNCFKKWQPYMATRLWDFEQELSALPFINPQTCKDVISRQALLKLMGEEPLNWTDSDKELQAVEDYRNFKNMVEQLPSVNPQPKTGHWIGIDDKPHEDYECNRCGYICSTFTANIKPSEEYKYCPNCGAKMESEDKE